MRVQDSRLKLQGATKFKKLNHEDHEETHEEHEVVSGFKLFVRQPNNLNPLVILQDLPNDIVVMHLSLRVLRVLCFVIFVVKTQLNSLV